MRPIWTGSISFGLVNIPVKLYLAARSERPGFRMLHKPDEGPIQFRRFCSLEEKEVAYEEIVRGFEYEKGAFVVIEDEDFDRIERPSSRVIEVQQFVGRDEIEPIFFETPYYLEPTKGAERAYALMRAALRKSAKVGVGRVAFREREHLAVVHGSGNALCLSTIRYAHDIRSTEGLAIPDESADLPEKQVDLALTLMEQLSAPFDATSFRDDYQEKVEQMIQEKLAGMPAPKRAPARLPAQIVDLADVLQKSIDEAKKKGTDRGERRAPQHLAARAAREPAKKRGRKS